MTSSSQTIDVTPQHQPIIEFRNNEVYGLAADGFTAWQLGTDGYTGSPTSMPETLIRDFRVWHTYESAIWNYPVNRVTIDGLVYRIDATAGIVWWPSAVNSGDYRDVNLTIRGGSIHAGSVVSGIRDALGTLHIEGVDAVTRDTAFSFGTPATPGTGADRPPSGVQVVLRNNSVRPWPGQPLRTIELRHDMSYANSQPNDLFEVFVYDYQRQPGNEFRVYFREQSTQSLYGSLAPCNDTTSRPEVAGITCAMNGVAPPPPPPSAPAPPRNVRIVP
jgi:hypothetical protein